VLFAVLAGLTALGSILFGRRLLLFALDPEMATAVGMRTSLWAAAFCIWLGLSVGLSVRASGMLYSFGMLVLPALFAKNICREVRPMLIVSPVVAVAIATVGFVLANYYDFPPAQMTVALACLVLVAVWALSRFRR
jgi:ABC-type Mn2+/Zn2+ transport system permease subunit